MKPDGTVRVGYAVHYDPTCETCILHSKRDACCQLTGETRRGGDPACAQHSDGRVDDKTKRGGEGDQCN